MSTDTTADRRAPADAKPTPIIETLDLSVHFGGKRALENVTCALAKHKITAVVGPNGAGKTTLLNALGAFIPARQVSGSIRYDGVDLDQVRSAQLAARGFARAFQDPRLIDDNSLVENVLTGAHAALRYSVWDQVLRPARCVREERRRRAEAHGLLDEMGLSELADKPVANLPYGPRKLCDFARAAIGDPPCLLLDEPSSGLDANEQDRLVGIIRDRQRRTNASVVLVEHHMDVVERLADDVLVLVAGAVFMHGPTREVLGSRRFQDVLSGAAIVTKEGS
jgi:ABC-type branched-subunit amino acid transport system ATPase component